MKRVMRKLFAWLALLSVLGLNIVPFAAIAQDKPAAEAPAKADDKKDAAPKSTKKSKKRKYRPDP